MISEEKSSESASDEQTEPTRSTGSESVSSTGKTKQKTKGKKKMKLTLKSNSKESTPAPIPATSASSSTKEKVKGKVKGKEAIKAKAVKAKHSSGVTTHAKSKGSDRKGSDRVTKKEAKGLVKSGKGLLKSGKKTAKLIARTKPTSLPATPKRPGVQTLLAKKGFARATKGGKPMRSSWVSRTHLRAEASKKAPVLCQNGSKSKIWKRDLVSVGPGKEKSVTCQRCIRIRKAEQNNRANPHLA